MQALFNAGSNPSTVSGESTWQNPNNEIANYDVKQNYDCQSNDIAHSVWDSAEIMAWRCNQSDTCKGFNRYKGGYGGYFKTVGLSNGTCPGGVSTNSYDFYSKKSTNWRKANNPKLSDPSILKDSDRTTNIVGWVDWASGTTAGSCTGGGAPWNFFTGVNSQLNNSSLINDNMSGYKIPLGWKFIFDENTGWGDGNTEGYYDRRDGWTGGSDFSGCFNIDVPNGHGMNDKTSSAIIQNIGFNVDLHWNDMVEKGVTPHDEKLIKSRWCDSLGFADLMSNTSRCTPALRDPGDSSSSTTNFDTKLVNLCLADTGFTWINNAGVLTYLKSIVRNGHDTNGQVATLFQTYCRGSPLASASKSTGPNRTNAICSCINVGDFGYQGTSNCFDAPMKTYPGCADFTDQGQTFLGVTTRIGPIVSMPDNPEKSSAINAMGNNPACIAGACAWAERSNNSYLSPYATTCPAMAVQICSQQVNIGVAMSSPINTSCHQEQTVTVTTNYGGSTPASTTVGGNGTTTMNSPSPPAPAPRTPAPKTSSSLPFPSLEKYLNTSTKQYGGIGGCICIMMMCVLMIIVLAMSGDEDGGGNGGIAAFLAAQSAGRGATAGI